MSELVKFQLEAPNPDAITAFCRDWLEKQGFSIELPRGLERPIEISKRLDVPYMVVWSAIHHKDCPHYETKGTKLRLSHVAVTKAVENFILRKAGREP